METGEKSEDSNLFLNRKPHLLFFFSLPFRGCCSASSKAEKQRSLCVPEDFIRWWINQPLKAGSPLEMLPVLWDDSFLFGLMWLFIAAENLLEAKRGEGFPEASSDGVCRWWAGSGPRLYCREALGGLCTLFSLGWVVVLTRSGSLQTLFC